MGAFVTGIWNLTVALNELPISTPFLVYHISSPKFFCHATIDGEVDAAVKDEQDLRDASGDHCPEGDLQTVLFPSVVVVLQSYELVNVEDDSGMQGETLGDGNLWSRGNC